jgi:hypothetical protein
METGRFVVHDGKMESGVESETGSYGQKRSFWLMELTVSKSARTAGGDLNNEGPVSAAHQSLIRNSS